MASRAADRRHLRDEHPPVLAQVALGVAQLVGLLGAEPHEGVLGDADVVGVGELLRVVAEQLLAREADHAAEGVVDRDDAVLEVAEEHGRHVVLEGQAEALVAFADQGFVARQTLGVTQPPDAVGELVDQLAQRRDLVGPEVVRLRREDSDHADDLVFDLEGKGAHRAQLKLLGPDSTRWDRR